MDFLEALDYLKKQNDLNNHSLSQATGIPYTTIDGWYKKGYDRVKLSTLRVLCDYFDVSLDMFIGRETHNSSTLAKSEELYIKKYRALDEHGKDIIDCILSKEYERCSAQREQNHQKSRIIKLSIQPASAGSGVWLDSDSFDDFEIPDIPEYRSADFAVRITGDSMEPTYSDGDIVLVSKQVELNPGDIGLFSLNGKGYIKELGYKVLLSHNKKYTELLINDSIKFYGKVIGKIDG